MIYIMGGIKIAFRLAGSEMRLLPAPIYRGYICIDPAEVTLQVHLEGFPESKLGPPIFMADNWTLFKVGDKTVFQVRFFGYNHRLNINTAVLDPGGLSGDLYLGLDTLSTKNPASIEFPPPIFDALLIVHLLADRRGLMTHACGLLNGENSGLLFAGISGAGKSTTARIWMQTPGTVVLGDEKVIVRKHENRFWMYSTPWQGKGQIFRPGRAPLDQIFILHHAAGNQARRLKPVDAMSSLLVRSFLPYWDADGMAYTLEFLEELCQEIPCYELGFIPDGRVVDYVQCLTAI